MPGFRRAAPAISFLLIFLFALLLFYHSREMQWKTALPAQGVLPLAGKIIGVDPGHGGYDGGAEKGPLQEKDITLEIALYLRDYLRQAGAVVVMTRETDTDLLQLPVGPKKRTDLDHRLQILHEADVEMLVSLHANKIAASRWRGAQAFYRDGCPESKKLACSVQEELIRVLKNTDRSARTGDYYLLNQSTVPAVIVEAGFLSNPHEAHLLQQPDYQKKVAWSVYSGIVKFFSR